MFVFATWSLLTVALLGYLDPLHWGWWHFVHVTVQFLTDVFDIIVSFLYGLDFHFYRCCHIWFNPSVFWLKDSRFCDDGCVFGYIFCGVMSGSTSIRSYCSYCSKSSIRMSHGVYGLSSISCPSTPVISTSPIRRSCWSVNTNCSGWSSCARMFTR
jgi:hypothetical protein